LLGNEVGEGSAPLGVGLYSGSNDVREGTSKTARVLARVGDDENQIRKERKSIENLTGSLLRVRV